MPVQTKPEPRVPPLNRPGNWRTSALKREVRALAEQRDAVILAQTIRCPRRRTWRTSWAYSFSDFRARRPMPGRSGPPSAARTSWPRRLPSSARQKTVFAPRTSMLGARWLDSITAARAARWKARHPAAVAVMYVKDHGRGEGRKTMHCRTSSNAVQVVEHIYPRARRGHGDLFGPDMFLGAHRGEGDRRRMKVWDGECHVHAGIRPSHIADVRGPTPSPTS